MTKNKLTTKAVISTAVLALAISIMPTGSAFTNTDFGVIQAEASTTKYKTTDNLNLRTGASVNHKKMTTIPKGKEVTYVGKSGSWFKVKYGKQTGFVSSKYLTKVPAPKVTAKAPAKTPVTAPATPKSAGTITTYTTKDNLNMRTGGSTSHKIVASIPKGKVVEMVTYNSTWSKVKYGSKTGFVSTKYLNKTVKNTTAPVKAPSTPKATAVTYVTTDNLNLRTGASTSHGIITLIPKGKSVTYISTSGSWYKVTYGTQTGFVSSAYLTKPGSTPAVTTAKYPAPSKNTPGLYKGDVLIVNKKYGLPSTYNPGINATAQKAVNAMVADAKKQGVTLTTISAYRSYSYQSTLYNNYVTKHGKAQADRFSARPGHSEHQTGLAFDFGGVSKTHWLESSFESTKEGKWLASNAHLYGFHLRYQKGKEHITGYMYEPWHFRYIGSDNAIKIKATGKTLEEYFNVAGK